MGVHGWAKVLCEEGYLPPYKQPTCMCSSTGLWRDLESMSCPTFANRLQVLPLNRSSWDMTMHIDGNGLAFHLHRIAYARHVEAVFSECLSSPKKRRKNKKSVKDLTLDQIRRLVPYFMPLQLLANITQEYLVALKQKGFAIKVYWDGPLRRVFKRETGAQRRAIRPQEWSELQLFCELGVAPQTSKCVCQWEDMFPKSRLFQAQIKHTVQCLVNAENIDCVEEADHHMARVVCNKKNDYILAHDTDFCFFPNIQYIPFSTLRVDSKNVTAVVIQRSEVADSIGLNVEKAMTELAILRGNDYLVDPSQAKLSFYARDVSDCIDHLNSQRPDYRITSTSEVTEETMRFIRALYGLEDDLSEFPLEDTRNSSLVVDQTDILDLAVPCELLRVDDDDSNTTEDTDDASALNIPRKKSFSIPDEVDLSLAKLQPLTDRSIKDAVLRCLQNYLDSELQYQPKQIQLTNSNGDKDSLLSSSLMISQEHLDIFAGMTMAENLDEFLALITSQDALWRPNWDDAFAVYLLEKTIAAAFALSFESPLVRFCSPATMFDAYRFHVLLQVHRLKKSGTLTSNSATIDNRMEPQEVENKEVVVERPVLPVDEFEDTILRTVDRNRVTIIQGGTGCGKSSRIPVMLLRAPPPSNFSQTKVTKLFISQPRRIAAKALVDRLRAVEPDLRDCFALRMGHGVREFESKDTRAWFVTTGYLVRLLANSPSRFDDISHLIIDEVHERSVDTDILCLLCRRLITHNKRIRLILMSATLAANLYQEYFQAPPPIVVGARRFDVKEVYLDELDKLSLPSNISYAVANLTKECESIKCSRAPSTQFMQKIFTLVDYLVLTLGRPGSSVLIFVAGMDDIVAIQESISKLYVAGVRFSCYPIHSDIPFEDQMLVFQAACSDEVKVIIATNSAESSVTLPDVDNVICLGLCKQIVYNQLSHRQMLKATWISKASATQRAGRTGRMRPGTVYRLYTRKNFLEHMQEFEPGEMLRIPLDSVILLLRGILSNEAVTDVLLDCLEVPSIQNIDRSFQSLHQSHFITEPTDFCEITTLGQFVSKLGIDLSLGSLIGLGVQFGVAAEAIQLAGVLSFPQDPWIMSNPLVHEPKSYNEMVKQTFVSKCRFDAALYSEPMATMNLLWSYEKLEERSRLNWCWTHSVQTTRIRRLSLTCKNLRYRVAEFFKIDESLLQVIVPPERQPHAITMILRCLQAWVFNETIIECRTKKFIQGVSKEGMTIKLQTHSDKIEQNDLKEIMYSGRHNVRIDTHSEILQQGTFKFDNNESVTDITDQEARFVSYASAESLDCVAFWDNMNISIYISDKLMAAEFLVHHIQTLRDYLTENMIVVVPTRGARRGIQERSCGLWSVVENPNPFEEHLRFRKFFLVQNVTKKMTETVKKLLSIFKAQSAMKCLFCGFSQKRKKGETEHYFDLTTLGCAKGISERDMKDLFMTPNMKVSKKVSKVDNQKLFFAHTSPDLHEPGSNSIDSDITDNSSQRRPLLRCIPEGVRLLSVLASGRRREHCIKLTPKDICKTDVSNDDESESVLEIFPDAEQTKLSSRWKRFNSSSVAFIQENSVPGTALPIEGIEVLYCCAANTLEISGGAVKAEGLTLLPPGRLFLLLNRLSFGVFGDDIDKETLVENSIQFLISDDVCIDKNIEDTELHDWYRRILLAINFHESAKLLGEQLLCFPRMVRQLLSIFDGIDGYCTKAWDVDSNPLTRDNIKTWQESFAKIGKTVSILEDLQDDEIEGIISDTILNSTETFVTQGGGVTSFEDELVSSQDNLENNRGREVSLQSDKNTTSDFQHPSHFGRHMKNKPAETDEISDLLEAKLILDATSHLAFDQVGKKTKKSTKYAKSISSKKESGSKIATSTLAIAESIERLSEFDPALLVESRQWLSYDLPSKTKALKEFPPSKVLALVIKLVRDELGHTSITQDEMSLEDGLDWQIKRFTVKGQSFYQAVYTNRHQLSTTRSDGKIRFPDWISNVEDRFPDNINDVLKCVPSNYRKGLRKRINFIRVNEFTEVVFSDVETAVQMQSAFWLERQFLTRKNHWFQKDMGSLIQRLTGDCKYKQRQLKRITSKNMMSERMRR